MKRVSHGGTEGTGIYHSFRAICFVLFVPFVVSLITGCATPQRDMAMRDSYADYLAQARTYQAVAFRTGPGAEITIKGEVEVAMDAPLNPLGKPALPPDTIAKVAGTVGSTLKTVAGMWFGYRAVDSMSSTRDPVVVEQPPAQIIQVPAGL